LPQVRIFTAPFCVYCVAAKRFFNQRGISFEEVDVAKDDAIRDWLVATTNQRTVPQIFIGERSIGGYTDMKALDERGELMPLLAGIS
jgi:glutaredoxin 3